MIRTRSNTSRTSTISSSSSAAVFLPTMEALDLSMINEVYGPYADLYKDVLKISVTASSEDIQTAANRIRRVELVVHSQTGRFGRAGRPFDEPQTDDTSSLGLGSIPQRQPQQGSHTLKQKMDALETAVQILLDPYQRYLYDSQIRRLRLLKSHAHEQQQQQQQRGSPWYERHTSFPRAMDLVDDIEDKKEDDHFNKRGSSKSKERRREWPRPQQEGSSSSRRYNLSHRKSEDDKDVEEEEEEKENCNNGRASIRRVASTASSTRSGNESRRQRLQRNHSWVEPTGREEEKTRSSVRRSTCPHDGQKYHQDDEEETHNDDDDEDDDDDDDDDEREERDRSFFSWIFHSRILRIFSSELGDACHDTLLSVDQVFNAFTITDKNIKAVTKRIDRAKKDMES